MFSKAQVLEMSTTYRKYLSQMTYNATEVYMIGCYRMGILEESGSDGESSQQIATAFSNNNHLSSFFLENCLLHM